jgi:hypothetical protein
LLLVLIGWLHMATLFLTVLFGYFSLNFLSFGRSKLLGVSLYLIGVAAIGYGLFFFSRQAYKTLPEIADTTIPAVVNFAERKGIELPFRTTPAPGRWPCRKSETASPTLAVTRAKPRFNLPC